MGMGCLQVSLGSLSAGMVARWLPGSLKYYCHDLTWQLCCSATQSWRSCAHNFSVPNPVSQTQHVNNALINTILCATIKRRPWWDVDTWNSYFRGGDICLILKIHRLGEHVRRVNRLREQNGADKGEYKKQRLKCCWWSALDGLVLPSPESSGLGSVSVAVASARKTDVHARGARTHIHTHAGESDARGMGLLAFLLTSPVTITESQSAHK